MSIIVFISSILSFLIGTPQSQDIAKPAATVELAVSKSEPIEVETLPTVQASKVEPADNIASQPKPPGLIEFAYIGKGVGAASVVASTSVSHKAETIINGVQDVYKKTNQLTAGFEQTYHNKTFGMKQVSKGKIWIKKPGKMRWDYAGKRKSTKPRKSFISDGTTFWAIEHNNKQVFRKSLKDDVMPVIVSFLLGTGDLNKEYDATIDTSTKYGSKGEWVLKLEPKVKSTVYKRLYLVVDKNYQVKASVVVEASNNINHVKFLSPDLTKEVKDSWFAFDAKTAKAKNYRIIERGSKPKK